MANSFFRNVLTRVIEARERQVAPYVNKAMMNFNDQQLGALGISRAELGKKPRASGLL